MEELTPISVTDLESLLLVQEAQLEKFKTPLKMATMLLIAGIALIMTLSNLLLYLMKINKLSFREISKLK